MSEPILAIRGLEKSFKTGTKALAGVDLTINRGERLGASFEGFFEAADGQNRFRHAAYVGGGDGFYKRTGFWSGNNNEESP